MRLMSLLLLIALTACVPGPAALAEPTAARQPTAEITQALTPTRNIQPVIPTAPAEPTATTTSIAPTEAAAAGLCSPLKDMAIEALPAMISNPYHPPRPGYDDPHAGIDLAVQISGSQVAVAGHPVQAALPGRVAMVSVDRFPFGNAIIIETPLEQLSADWQRRAALPTPAPTLPPLSALTCPPGPVLEGSDPSQRSIYTLYGHLQDPPQWAWGDLVACGQEIGQVGGTGNALNPHLHFETRTAPAGIRLHAMAHYDASASAEEMSAYCLWSVSGLFQLVDPQKALGILPQAR